MKTLKQKLGARIQEIRRSKKLTQEKLAEIIDMDKPNLSNIECGRRFMTAETLEKIACALDVKESELFNFEHLEERQKLIEEINKAVEGASDDELKYIFKMISSLKFLKK